MSAPQFFFVETSERLFGIFDFCSTILGFLLLNNCYLVKKGILFLTNGTPRQKKESLPKKTILRSFSKVIKILMKNAIASMLDR